MGTDDHHSRRTSRRCPGAAKNQRHPHKTWTTGRGQSGSSYKPEIRQETLASQTPRRAEPRAQASRRDPPGPPAAAPVAFRVSGFRQPALGR